jgi:hypothetical protein
MGKRPVRESLRHSHQSLSLALGLIHQLISEESFLITFAEWKEVEMRDLRHKGQEESMASPEMFTTGLKGTRKP